MKEKQYFLTLDLKDDESLIRLYEEYHKPENVWPEVISSLAISGIRVMDIFRFETRLVMRILVNNNFNFKNKAELDKENVKVQEWEELMLKFQAVLPGENNESKWQLMSKVCSYDLSADCIPTNNFHLLGGL